VIRFVAPRVVGVCLALLLSAAPASAQIADVPGPGQAVPKPAPQCPQTIACSYDERRQMPSGYRFQAVTVCGANCTTQYWVSASDDGKPLIEIAPVRGGALIAVSRSTDGGGPSSVRTVVPGYGPTDPACCPSSFVDTTYTWDDGQATLVAGEPVSTPAGDADGLAGYHAKLVQDGYYEVFGGP
jgi:hypothetical protein